MGAMAKDGSSVQAGLSSIRCMLEPLPHQPITHLMDKEKTKCCGIPFEIKWTKKWWQKQNQFGPWFCPKAPITAKEFPLEIHEARTGLGQDSSQLLSKWARRNKEEVKATCAHLGSPTSVRGGVTPNVLASFQSGRCIPLQFQYYSHN